MKDFLQNDEVVNKRKLEIVVYYNLCCVLPNSFISDTTTVYTKTCLIGTQILGES